MAYAGVSNNGPYVGARITSGGKGGTVDPGPVSTALAYCLAFLLGMPIILALGVVALAWVIVWLPFLALWLAVSSGSQPSQWLGFGTLAMLSGFGMFWGMDDYAKTVPASEAGAYEGWASVYACASALGFICACVGLLWLAGKGLAKLYGKTF